MYALVSHESSALDLQMFDCFEGALEYVKTSFVFHTQGLSCNSDILHIDLSSDEGSVNSENCEVEWNKSHGLISAYLKKQDETIMYEVFIV